MKASNKFVVAARVAFWLLGALFVVQAAPELKPKALDEMVETERAFAKMGAEEGFFKSFYKYFGEEGIGFTPHPGKFRENARKNPPPDPPPTPEFRLEWWPVYGDVAASGDLGYNTGPILTSDLTAQKRPASHGTFFSVWKKQPAGNWEVVVDMGVPSGGPPASMDRTTYTRAPQEKFKAVKLKDAAAGKAEIMRLEAEFGKSAQTGVAGYLAYVAPRIRMNRPGRYPMTSKEEVAKYFDEIKLVTLSSEGIDGGISKSGEMGYSYGRFEVKVTRDGAERNVKGYFTHVWKRDAKGAWKLVGDVISGIPPAAPPAPAN